MKRFSLPKKRILFFKISLMVLLSLIIGIGTITVVSIRHQTKTIKTELIEKNKNISTHLASSAKNAFWSLNWLFVERQMKEVIASDDALFLAIIKPNGETYMSYGDKEWEDDLLNAKAILTEKQIVNDVTYSKTGEIAKRIITPIKVGNDQWSLIMIFSFKQIKNAQQAILRNDIRYGSIIFFLGMLLSSLFSRGMDRRINKLMEGIEEISKGNLDYKIVKMGRDELGNLATSFNAMTEELKKTTTSRDLLVKEMAERKQAEEALRDSEAQKKGILDASIDRIRLVDKDLRIIWANKTTVRELNMTPEDLVGHLCYKLLVGGDTPCIGCPAVKALSSGKIEHTLMQQTQSKTIEGKSYWDDYAVPIKDESGNVTHIIEITRNVTEQKRIETELIHANNFLQNILNSSIDGITTTDLEGKIIYTSPRTEDIIGYTREEVISKKAYTLYSKGIDDAKKIMRELMAKGEIKDHEMTVIRKDDTLVDINLSASLLRDEKGQIIGTLGIYRDITEKNMLEAQLAQAQRVEALGTLAGGIAHNFNNLLMGIQGNASLMLLETNPAHPNYQKLKTIEKSVQSGSRLTRQLLGYAREGKYEIKPINLNQLMKETSDTFSMTKKEIRIHLELAQDLFGIRADQGQIEQALLNLYVNAADAMPGGGNIFLKTINIKHNDIKKKPFKPKPGNYVLLTIRDTGIGMDKETMKRIFEPFFTTKGLAKGTGLGLASTYGIIKAHGGYIDVDSEKGHGTAFYVYLPASKKRTEKFIRDTDQIIEGKGTILLVDDEEIVLDASVNMLKKLGYTVLKAKGGREAVEMYQENIERINMVLLDIIMPDMSGSEVYDRIKEINPNIKVLLSSGYNIEGQATELLEKGCNGFIQKPFNMNELSQSINKILNKG
jgi:two-component system cell cycle sensor histidine kinase/response regulator CckA